MYTVTQTPEFQHWLDNLRDMRAQVRITTRLDHIKTGTLGDWKPLGGALFELRITYGPGYRLYFTFRGNAVVTLLAGGDKSNQDEDIQRARRILANLV